MKLFLVLLLAILLLQALVQASALSNEHTNFLANADDEESDMVALSSKHHKKINCKYACAWRCTKASRKNVCHRACKACCHKCHCVPPGTYGHKSACPCYAKLKTHGNKPKCP
ncbi:Gibberellin regulated protein [Corchorus olitorius]|uniref:Gibberellin regulated protein n=1 Tax=Corchorus olitorius TaxID=93759 RepID=A0A1R3KLL7_9ROSI|nr:Gibberellin regulated protein [Corchorus olitorius]